MDDIEIEESIRQQISENLFMLYMKGSPAAPKCGFSARAVEVLNACGEPFAYVDVLEHPEIRTMLPRLMNWPTFPQFYIKGELVGGSDILIELFEKGELQKMIQDAANS